MIGLFGMKIAMGRLKAFSLPSLCDLKEHLIPVRTEEDGAVQSGVL